METTIRQFQEEVRDILNQDTWFDEHGISWLCENTLDIEYEIKKNLGQTGLVAVVTTPNLTYQGEHKSVETVQNYEEIEIPVECVIAAPPATVTLLTDPRKEMRAGGELRFSDWYGQPSVFKWVPNSGFFWNAPTVEGTGEPYATITPPTDPTGTVWTAAIFTDSSYTPTTISIPASSEFKNGWKTHDEQGREIVVSTSGENQVTVSGGCFGSHSMVLTIGEESTEIVGDTEYVAIVTFENEIPKNATMSTRTGNMIGKPFDHKLSWVNVEENLISDTGFAPSLSVPWSMEMMVHTSNNSEMYPIISTGDEFRIRFVANSNQLQGTYGNRTVTNNFGCFRDTTGQMRAWNGANPSVYRSVNPIKVGFSLNSSTTAANRIYNQGYFGDNCYSAPNGTNNAITVTDGFTILLFGTNTGNYSDHKFDGKFYYSRIFSDGSLARDLYPVLVNGTIRIFDNVTGAYLADIINTLTPDAGTNYEIDEDWETVTTDTSTVDFTEYVSHINKGFDTEISLQIIENPTVNRGKPDKDAIATALDVGHRAVYTLSGYDTEHYNDFNPSTIKQSTVAGAGGKLLQVDCRFTSTPVL